MEEIEREKARAPVEYEMQSAVENYLAKPEEAESKIYMGWDIYAPYSPAAFNELCRQHMADPNNVNG